MNVYTHTLRNTPLYIVVLFFSFLTKAQDLTLTATASFTDSKRNTKLDGARAVVITSFTPTDGDAEKTYALVTANRDDAVQIIDITNPESPTHVAVVQDDEKDTGSSFTTLDGPQSITTVTISDKHYALVAASSDDGLQIIEITDPTNPEATAALVHNEKDSSSPQNTYALDGATSVSTITISQKTYALVAALNGKKNLEIIDISAPASPKIVSSIAHESTDADNTAYALNLPLSVTTVTIGSQHYALVGTFSGKNVQIIEITDPANPKATASASGDDYKLNYPYGITTTTIDNKTYALVAASGSNAMQIIDISNPESPSAIASPTDGEGYEELGNAYSVSTTTIGGKPYAVVAAYADDGVQIIDISDPDEPSAAGSAADSTDSTNTDYNTLDGARSVSVTTIDGSTYAVVAAYEDDGIQIIKLEGSSLGRSEDFASQWVVLSPNPAQTELHLAYAQDTTVSYTVYDLTGRQLATHQQGGTTHSLDISNLPTGGYLLKAKQGNQKGIFRFVKE